MTRLVPCKSDNKTYVISARNQGYVQCIDAGLCPTGRPKPPPQIAAVEKYGDSYAQFINIFFHFCSLLYTLFPQSL